MFIFFWLIEMFWLGKLCRMYECKIDRLLYIIDLSSFVLCLDFLKLICILYNYCSISVNIFYLKIFKWILSFFFSKFLFYIDIFVEKLIILEWRVFYLNKGYNVKFISWMFVFDFWFNWNIMVIVKIYIWFSRVVWCLI